jgi:hypothetical protein
MKHTFYMMSDFPPWQVYRWRLDHSLKLDIIERYDAKKEQWVTHPSGHEKTGAHSHGRRTAINNSFPVDFRKLRRILQSSHY